MTTERHNRIDYVELTATDQRTFAQSKTFYSAVFGWEYKNWGPAYSDTHSSGVTSGIALNDKPRQPLPVVYSESLEATRAAVIAAGAKVSLDIVSFPGGRRFQFIDPAGNELGVWSDK